MTTSKRTGTRFETAVANVFLVEGVAAYRNAPSGSRDKGDLTILDWDAICECKATKALDLAGAVTEAKLEAMNAGKRFGIAVIKRRMANARRSYVVMELEDFIHLMQKP